MYSEFFLVLRKYKITQQFLAAQVYLMNDCCITAVLLAGL